MLVALLWGCTGSPSPSPTAPDRTTTSSPSTTEGVVASSTTSTAAPTSETTTLRVGTLFPVDSLDPADALEPGDMELLQAVSDGLLRTEPGNGEIVPGIAEAHPEVSDDGLTYTFRLRGDVVFADGLELTAPIYVDSIERVMELGGRGSDLVSLFVSSIEAPDESTVVFHLRDRFAFFPTLLAGATYLPAHPDVYPADELTPLPEAPIYGVGPWFISSYSESEVVLEPNLDYVGNEVEPGRIEIRVFESGDDMANALESGDIDLIWRGLDGSTAESLSDVDDVNVATVPGGTIHFLTINHGLEPTDDPLVRRAIAELIDRQTIAESVLGGAFVPAFSPVPPGYAGSSDAFLDLYGEPDVAAAIEHLTEAGYSETNPAELEVAYPPERFGLAIAAAMDEIQLQLESTGLIDVTLTAQPWNTYLGDVVEGEYTVAFLGWLHDFPDVHNYLAPFVLEGGLGGSGENLQNPEISEMVIEAAGEFDQPRRAELYEEIQALFAEDVVTVPLWIEHPYVAYRGYVAGDDEYENLETLNIGASMQLDYRALEVTPPESR